MKGRIRLTRFDSTYLAKEKLKPGFHFLVIVYLTQQTHSFALASQQYTGPYMARVGLHNHTLEEHGLEGFAGNLPAKILAFPVDLIATLALVVKR